MYPSVNESALTAESHLGDPDYLVVWHRELDTLYRDKLKSDILASTRHSETRDGQITGGILVRDTRGLVGVGHEEHT